MPKRKRYIRKLSFLSLLLVMILVAGLFINSGQPAFAQDSINTTTSTTAATEYENGSNTVFTSASTGYVFYRSGMTTPNNSGEIVFAKTVNGGTNWSGETVVNSVNTHLPAVAVWYDRWTPGNTTGNIIHVVSRDSTNGTSDLYYNEVDISNSDAVSTTINLTNGTGSITKTNTFGTSANNTLPAIGVATDASVYIGVSDGDILGDQSYVLKCSTSCTTVGNWTEPAASPLPDGASSACSGCKNPELALMPLAFGNMLLIENTYNTTGVSPSVDTYASKVWTTGTNTWDSSWTNIDTAAQNNTTYRGGWGATINPSTNAIYIAYPANNNALTNTNEEIRTAVYASGTWTSKTKVLTGESRSITAAKISLDKNTGNLYAVYSLMATNNSATTAIARYKLSTDGMATWGSESASLSSAVTDMQGLKVNIMNSDRIYANWVDKQAGSTPLIGATVAVVTPANTAPAAPTLSQPVSGSVSVSPLPIFQLSTTDADNDYLRYKFDICTTSNCSSVLTTITQPSGSPQTGWTNQNQQTLTAYTGSSVLSGSTMAVYSYQFTDAVLSASTQYWWRGYAIDPGGTNTYGSASAISTFTTGSGAVNVNGGVNINGGTNVR